MQNALNSMIAAVILLTGTILAASTNETDIDTLLSLMEAKKEQAANSPAKMNESREHYVAGEFGKARQGFEEIIKIDPENTEARV